MSEPFYVVESTFKYPRSPIRRTFEDRTKALLYAGLTDAFRDPDEDYEVHMYEVTEIDFTK